MNGHVPYLTLHCALIDARIGPQRANHAEPPAGPFRWQLVSELIKLSADDNIGLALAGWRLEGAQIWQLRQPEVNGRSNFKLVNCKRHPTSPLNYNAKTQQTT